MNKHEYALEMDKMIWTKKWGDEAKSNKHKHTNNAGEKKIVSEWASELANVQRQWQRPSPVSMYMYTYTHIVDVAQWQH